VAPNPLKGQGDLCGTGASCECLFDRFWIPTPTAVPVNSTGEFELFFTLEEPVHFDVINWPWGVPQNEPYFSSGKFAEVGKRIDNP
jgi:hypothetical protein